MAAIVSAATSNVVVNAGPASPNKLAFASSVGVPSMDGLSNPDWNTPAPDSSTVATPTTSSEAASELAPHAPTRIVVARKGKNVMVLWTPPDNAMALSHEVLFYRNRKIVAKVLTSSSSGIRVYGLKSGTYAVRVRAITTAGISALSQHKVLRVK
jgi:predicted phage tail protein